MGVRAEGEPDDNVANADEKIEGEGEKAEHMLGG